MPLIECKPSWWCKRRMLQFRLCTVAWSIPCCFLFDSLDEQRQHPLAAANRVSDQAEIENKLKMTSNRFEWIIVYFPQQRTISSNDLFCCPVIFSNENRLLINNHFSWEISDWFVYIIYIKRKLTQNRHSISFLASFMREWRCGIFDNMQMHKSERFPLIVIIFVFCLATEMVYVGCSAHSGANYERYLNSWSISMCVSSVMHFLHIFQFAHSCKLQVFARANRIAQHSHMLRCELLSDGKTSRSETVCSIQLLLLSNEFFVLLLFLLAQCQVWLPSINNVHTRVCIENEEKRWPKRMERKNCVLHCAHMSSRVARSRGISAITHFNE